MRFVSFKGAQRWILSGALGVCTLWACARTEAPGPGPSDGPPPGSGQAGAPGFLPNFLCGNGRVDEGEECDDGNELLGDGCAECRFEPGPERDQCPGQLVSFQEEEAGVWRGAFQGTTVGYFGHFQAQSVGLCAERVAADVVYRWQAPRTGRLRLQLDAEFDASIQVRTLCELEAALAQPDLNFAERQALRSQELLCKNARIGAGREEVTLQVEKDQEYFVIVNSPRGQEKGRYELSWELSEDEPL